MTTDDLYSLRVETNYDHRLIVLTGSRETLLNVAVRAMLDCAPAWNEQTTVYPQFTVALQKFKGA